MATLTRNRLLDCLPDDLRTSLLANAEHVNLPLRTVLFEPDRMPRYVHLLTSGVASIVVHLADSEAVEIGFVGSEGFPERTQVLGPQLGSTQCFMQVPGTAFRLELQTFQAAFRSNPLLLKLVHQFQQHEGLVVAQLGACNRLHEVEGRLARWLLMLHARLQDRELYVTQEYLGTILGTRRSSVNLAVGSLQRSGIIHSSRGMVVIDDLAALEGVACECYPVIAKLFDNLYR